VSGCLGVWVVWRGFAWCPCVCWGVRVLSLLAPPVMIGWRVAAYPPHDTGAETPPGGGGGDLWPTSSFSTAGGTTPGFQRGVPRYIEVRVCSCSVLIEVFSAPWCFAALVFPGSGEIDCRLKGKEKGKMGRAWFRRTDGRTDGNF